MTLAEVKEGQTVKIKKINSKGAIKQRLLDMGLGRGVVIFVERYAPLKDPIEIKVKGYSLALRVEEGRMVEIDNNLNVSV
jgi:Fe2+ transport system protein FeoA